MASVTQEPQEPSVRHVPRTRTPHFDLHASLTIAVRHCAAAGDDFNAVLADLLAVKTMAARVDAALLEAAA